jgi:hypothetical protein
MIDLAACSKEEYIAYFMSLGLSEAEAEEVYGVSREGQSDRIIDGRFDRKGDYHAAGSAVFDG